MKFSSNSILSSIGKEGLTCLPYGGFCFLSVRPCDVTPSFRTDNRKEFQTNFILQLSLI